MVPDVSKERWGFMFKGHPAPSTSPRTVSPIFPGLHQPAEQTSVICLELLVIGGQRCQRRSGRTAVVRKPKWGQIQRVDRQTDAIHTLYTVLKTL